jgi:uncharacterized protein with NAD-binding domain and iron-sulfur cluster
MTVNKTVVIFGAGISGLTAAHYLIRRGYKVTVIEPLYTSGGLARSRRIGNQFPTEYSWRGFGPWYHNVFDITKEIKFGKKTVYDTQFSRGILFHLLQDKLSPNHQTKPLYSIPGSYRCSTYDKIKFYMLMAKGFTANKRSKELYSNELASDYWHRKLSPKAAQTFAWVFGPFIGSDANKVSRHHVSSFFQKNIFPGHPAPHMHYDENPARGQSKRWKHGSLSKWLILKRPSNESWFDPWTKQLIEEGVKFKFGNTLIRLNSGDTITSATVMSEDNIEYDIVADYYVAAINPFNMKDILNRTPQLLEFDEELRKFDPLVASGEHRQIAFRFAFKEDIKFPDTETAIILTDSEFDITMFSQSQLWYDDVNLGKVNGTDVKTLWSGTTTIDSKRGSLFHMPKKNLTKSQFIAEVKHQVYRSKDFNRMIQNSNNGKNLSDYTLLDIEVWHKWIFPEDNHGIITSEEPKWVNSVGSRKHHPKTLTSFPNLLLAGSHTETNADLWSMEGACESGRRAADKISGHDSVIRQNGNVILKTLKGADDLLYDLQLPNILVILLLIAIVILSYLINYYRAKTVTSTILTALLLLGAFFMHILAEC